VNRSRLSRYSIVPLAVTCAVTIGVIAATESGVTLGLTHTLRTEQARLLAEAKPPETGVTLGSLRCQGRACPIKR
jgi:hypothetical protein